MRLPDHYQEKVRLRFVAKDWVEPGYIVLVNDRGEIVAGILNFAPMNQENTDGTIDHFVDQAV